MPFGDTLHAANALIVGANQGIGLGFVRQLLSDQRYSRIYATYRTPERAEALFALQKEQPERLHCLPLDLTDEAQIEGAIATLSTLTPQLHLVLSCVGLLHEGDLQPEKSLRQLNADQLLRYFQVNSIGGALLAKQCLPLLKHSAPSVLAAISAKIGSIGDNQLGGWYGYRASKAALNMLFRTAAVEYSRKSPKTILALLHPGTTDTQLSQPFQRGVPPEKLFPVERTVAQLMAVIEKLESTDSGEFFSWDGSRLPW
ncbi:SDR family NAD(P)-dependent oxidoreductase [Pseudanabaena sp. FACHB-2040]|uniref:SDR family NAD(P)-dependent oxidoreductase n=1 Tax=Pseudanabaena sp. FACHB-2040 TaxID=2692859 RepID=UPI001689C477|nr:SDR family NAD(P)-dependent oxidoreductase [Pseudanabaena sp. FACHB-2040]